MATTRLRAQAHVHPVGTTWFGRTAAASPWFYEPSHIMLRLPLSFRACTLFRTKGNQSLAPPVDYFNFIGSSNAQSDRTHNHKEEDNHPAEHNQSSRRNIHGTEKKKTKKYQHSMYPLFQPRRPFPPCPPSCPSPTRRRQERRPNKRCRGANLPGADGLYVGRYTGRAGTVGGARGRGGGQTQPQRRHQGRCCVCRPWLCFCVPRAA